MHTESHVNVPFVTRKQKIQRRKIRRQDQDMNSVHMQDIHRVINKGERRKFEARTF